MKILITGGCGYKGSILIPKLLKKGHEIINIDTQWFGNYLEKDSKLKNICGDIRDLDQEILKDIDTIIHLANIANDPAVELNPILSWEVNVLSGQQLIDKAARFGVNQFIFASSGSVYGLKEEKNELIEIDSKYYVTEKKSNDDLRDVKKKLDFQLIEIKKFIEENQKEAALSSLDNFNLIINDTIVLVIWLICTGYFTWICFVRSIKDY